LKLTPQIELTQSNPIAKPAATKQAWHESTFGPGEGRIMSEAAASDTTRPPPAPAPMPAAAEAPKPPRRRLPVEFLVRAVIILAALAVVVVLTRYWDAWVGASNRQVTDDAYIRGDITPLSAKVDGYVRDVAVGDYQIVKAGELLVEIENDDYRARVAQAYASWLGAEAAVGNLKARKDLQHAQIDQAQSTIAVTQADVDRTKQELQRQRNLLASSYGTAQKVEQAIAEQKRFEATLVKNQAELAAARRQMAVLDTEEIELRADAKAKHAALELARITLGYTWIAAPVDGLLGERGVRPGQYVHAGTQVLSVVPLDNVWVVANYKETQLTHVAVGQKAEIAVDTFPDVVVQGKVAGISPASGSQFSLLPPDNATGNFTKVVQRLAVKIALDPGNPLAGKLRPGMSVAATIFTDDSAGKP
jgi:membrane fusion protein (multidrug efflux system)